jgi:hypothetical protein
MTNREPDDLQAKAEEVIEQTTKEARGVVDEYLTFLQKTISSYPSGGTELGEKLKSCAEENITTIRDYIRNLGQAKDFQEVLRIQAGFMQSQFSALVEQTRSLSAACAKATADAVGKPFNRAA